MNSARVIAVGLAEYRGVTDDDLDDPYAFDRGIEKGGSLLDLTPLGYLAYKADADGWIAWSGGENPVGDAVVEVRIHDGSTMFGTGDEWDWNCEIAPITAFRLSLPTDRRAGSIAPPSAGPGLESVGHFYQTLPGVWTRLSLEDGNTTELVTRQSAAAALEAAAERERELRAKLDAEVSRGTELFRIGVDWQDRATRAEAQVAALREALERIAAATPRNTNSDTAAEMASWAQAVAATALSAIPTLGRE